MAGPRQNPSKLRLYSRVVVCEIRKIEIYYIELDFHARRLHATQVNVPGVWESFWERFYICRSTFGEKSRFSAPKRKSQNRQAADIARKRRSAARLQTDARPSRDGSEKFGSGTQAYGQI